MSEIKYSENADKDITPIKRAASAISFSAKKVTLGGDTNLPGATEFANETIKIQKRLLQLSEMACLDANEVLAAVAIFNEADRNIAEKIKSYSERVVCD